ncbi:hypothetical protein N7462_005003 [Penicillium macrosclerotiorum]|uniref:uncharacterized protein n=1 Tax=Penicillium macrosclerotiorum TaxID=303699 RepID=UPI0025483CC1|nr:uncharacterized protein N7462_005003 [Penicillium macrosclerotiorum]KAJ5690611.1 hypothetical protein N7462_005003 [Penicillium macrosclerotiorum]
MALLKDEASRIEETREILDGDEETRQSLGKNELDIDDYSKYMDLASVPDQVMMVQPVGGSGAFM